MAFVPLIKFEIDNGIVKKYQIRKRMQRKHTGVAALAEE